MLNASRHVGPCAGIFRFVSSVHKAHVFWWVLFLECHKISNYLDQGGRAGLHVHARGFEQTDAEAICKEMSLSLSTGREAGSSVQATLLVRMRTPAVP